MIYIDEGSPDQIRDLREAAELFLRILLSRKHSQINLFIKLVEKDQFSDPKHDVATTKWADDWMNPKEFTIKLYKKLPGKTMIKTLGHELVHVKQMFLGQVVEMDEGKVVFRKRKYNANNMEYNNQPWEEEAHLMEEILYFEWRHR